MIGSIRCIHSDMTKEWHEGPVEHSFSDWRGLIADQHRANFLLWHEEDKARDRGASDAVIAQVKRNIDKLNQQRNDLIEQIDDWIGATIACDRPGAAPMNSETPGSIIDRLSIMELRVYHYREELERQDGSEEIAAKVRRCCEQRQDLLTCLRILLGDIRTGKKRHKTYRQMKMYNDPRFNPYLRDS